VTVRYSATDGAGMRCVGSPFQAIHGCGGPRAPRDTGDPRLRWLCAQCAHRVALQLKLADPRQLALPFEVRP